MSTEISALAAGIDFGLVVQVEIAVEVALVGVPAKYLGVEVGTDVGGFDGDDDGSAVGDSITYVGTHDGDTVGAIDGLDDGVVGWYCCGR